MGRSPPCARHRDVFAFSAWWRMCVHTHHRGSEPSGARPACAPSGWWSRWQCSHSHRCHRGTVGRRVHVSCDSAVFVPRIGPRHIRHMGRSRPSAPIVLGIIQYVQEVVTYLI